ncbi:hypothetical protein conserved [Leishmania donovani]|uniref:Uncharacterized protein n=3 Tax=Leishmania donovani species complex TaxID=38574 RepID=A4I801_LEIIN|nr:conserved hypothetical protein [Leishmania infantum JPCM5]XP_003863611.1 hypothetical protein, conserved [Leishmania donovani]CAC9525296.1 hypothetical_protein_-_conserved [Leishmania infantum]AYU81742.1 hypothetical protein LdCL_320025000 [Leishmania donovani]TPP43706.1 hypothetical protein CGC21_20525 [Leishmania donovani]TPP47200.1 hypothetical protein CGC20_34275 [Leishmania donovani]CAJ1991727.1 hypothetical protein conserved [Leishmania donovani]|eukprot:XP_001467870.1 conserved hypothetical protein [Leishmania infantum JPCM5]
MSESYSGDYYHFVTQRSQAAEIVLPIPSFCKPLAASVRLFGEGKTGLLASFFDPEQHAWVVRQLPVHESWPHQPPPCLTVRVVTLVDPANLYELRVSLSSVLDGIDNDELCALQRRSQIYGLLLEEHLDDKSGAALRCAGAEGRLPQLREAVTLAAPVDVMDGFVLTGGGFLSDFPVLRDGPALPRSISTVYDDILAGDDFCGPPMPAGGARFAGTDLAAETSGGRGSGSPMNSNELREYTAWSVTAAANAGLACISISLRRRSPIEWSQLQSESHHIHSASLHESMGPGASLSISPGPVWAKPPPSVVSDSGALTVVQGSGAPVSGLRPNEHGDGGNGAHGVVSAYSSAAVATTAARPLLETLTLRGEVEVKLSRRDGEEWGISLPPPHGSLKFPMGPNRELVAAARRYFYCE